MSFRGDEHASLSTFLDLLGVRRLGLLGVLVFGLLGVLVFGLLGVRCLGLFGVLVFGLLGVRRLGLLGVLRLGLLGTLSVVGFRGMPFFSLFFFFNSRPGYTRDYRPRLPCRLERVRWERERIKI